MVLVNEKNVECKAEVCLRNNDSPVLVIGGKRIFPATVQHKFWRILYASRVERQALSEGGYRIPNVSLTPLRLID
jgi:hypothetical protein